MLLGWAVFSITNQSQLAGFASLVTGNDIITCLEDGRGLVRCGLVLLGRACSVQYNRPCSHIIVVGQVKLCQLGDNVITCLEDGRGLVISPLKWYSIHGFLSQPGYPRILCEIGWQHTRPCT